MELAEGEKGLLRHGDMNTNCSFWNDDDSIDIEHLFKETIKFVKKTIANLPPSQVDA